MWKSDVPPRAGMPVDVAFNGNGVPEAVFAVSDSEVAREQAQKALSGAFRHGEVVTTNVKGRFTKSTIAAEMLMLLSFFFLACLLGWACDGAKQTYRVGRNTI